MMTEANPDSGQNLQPCLILFRDPDIVEVSNGGGSMGGSGGIRSRSQARSKASSV